MEQVGSALQSLGIPYKVEGGRQINADLAGSGHHSFKITPHKGLYLDAATGKGGTIAALLHQIHAEVPAGAVAPAHPAKGGHERGTTTHAARLWGAGWTCTHEKDLPAGWDKGLNAAQKGHQRTKIEQQRDIVRAYLTARLGIDHRDHWSRQVRIGADGLMLTPMLKAGQIVGIQRTFFDQSGRKAERKMLGRHGVQVLTPPQGVAPRDLGIGKAILLAEGWETDAAMVQATGWSGICAYDAGGIVKWAEQQAIQAKGLTQNQIAQAPAVVTLVDRDESQTGQKAAARAVKILRAAGLAAYYAIPPAPENGGPKGGEKGSDWGDYPREGMSADVLVAHLALAIAHGDQEMPQVEPEKLHPHPHPHPHAHLMPVRPAQTPRRLNPTMATEEARDRVRQAVDRFIERARAWQQYWKLSDEDRVAAVKLLMPTIGLEITTGVGKSSAIRWVVNRLQAENLPTVIVAQDKNAARAYEKAGAFWRHGREDAESFDVAWHCPKMAQGSEISEQEHFWGPAICAGGHCEHGNKRALDRAETRDSEPSPQVVRFFRERPELKDSASDHCWLDHMEHAQKQYVITCTGQGFGPADMSSADGPRIVILDESVEWTHSHRVGLPELRGYLDGIDRLLPQLEQVAQGAGEDEEDARDTLTQLQAIRPMLQSVADALSQHCTTKGAAVDAPAEIIAQAQAIAEIADHHTQAWERPVWTRWTQLVDAPLRAAHEIITAAKNGALTIVNGTLLAVYLHPAIAEAIGHHPVLVADATMHPAAKAAILAADGEIVRVVAEQGLSWVCDPSRFRAAPQRDSRGHIDEAAIAPEVQGILDARIDLHREGRNISLIAQKPKAIRALAAQEGIPLKDLNAMPKDALWNLSIRAGIGWWGWHDRAHDEWAGHDLILWDQPAIPRDVLGDKWEEHRALRIAHGETPASIPHWSAEWVSDEWVCTGEQDQQSRAALHATPEIRAFTQSIMDAARMQAAGRARGVNHSGCRIYQMGGTPATALADHGISVGYRRLDGKVTDAERKVEQHEAAIHQFTVAAQRLVAQGQLITRQNLEEGCRSTGTDGTSRVCPTVNKGSCDRGTTPPTAPRHDTYREWFERYAPIFAKFMVANGRQARTIKAAQEAAQRFGEEMVKEALQMANLLFASRGGDADRLAEIAWDTVEYGDVTNTELVAARLVLEALNRTEGVPPPWS